jgi:hypothetical protein
VTLFLLLRITEQNIYWSSRKVSFIPVRFQLTLNLLKTTIVAPHCNGSKWKMGFNSAFKGLNKIFSCQIFDKHSNIKVHENLSSWSPVVPCERTERDR